MENKKASTPAPAPVNATPANNEMKKEGLNMENTRTLNRSAERRAALVNLRNAIIDIAPAYASSLLCGAPAPALDNVIEACRAYASSLACTKNGEKVEFTPVPASLLVPAAISLTCKGAKDEKRFVWDVKGFSFFKNVFTVDKVERSEKCSKSVFEATEKDYLKAKASSSKTEKPAWKVVYAGYTLEQKVAYQEYKAEKAIAKIRFEASAPADKKFEYINFDTWYNNRSAA